MHENNKWREVEENIKNLVSANGGEKLMGLGEGLV